MNALEFNDDEDEAVNRYQQPPPSVAPWFAYLVGCVLMVAAIVFVVEVVRVERAIDDTKTRMENVATNLKNLKSRD